MTHRNFEQEQADATWAAARYARWAVLVAALSTIINALVIAVALLVPAYQHSIEQIDTAKADKRASAQALLIAATIWMNVTDLSDADAFSEKLCRQGRIDPDTEVGRYYRRVSADFRARVQTLPAMSDMVSPQRLRGEANDVVSAFEYAIDTSSWDGNDRRKLCAPAWKTLADRLKGMRAELIQQYYEYSGPIRPQFPLLNGLEISSDPIFIGSGKTFDKEIEELKIDVRS